MLNASEAKTMMPEHKIDLWAFTEELQSFLREINANNVIIDQENFNARECAAVKAILDFMFKTKSLEIKVTQ